MSGAPSPRAASSSVAHVLAGSTDARPPAGKSLEQRIAELEAEQSRQLASKVRLDGYVMATIILAHAVAQSAGIPADNIIRTMRELAGRLDAAIRPDVMLAEIEATLKAGVPH